MAQTDKFRVGDLVYAVKNQGPSRSHFPSDCRAVVIEANGGYGLFLEGHGKHWWYEDEHLTLIEHNRADLLAEWEDAQEKELEQQSDLDWIFQNGPELVESCPGASVQTLGACLGVRNMWGSCGEGMTFYMNAMAVLDVARPYLKERDKQGFLDRCEEVKVKLEANKI